MGKNNTIYQVCFAGIGGQGVLLGARILGLALSNIGFNVLQTQSHGIEARGGASTGELIYGKCEINRLRATDPDLLLAMSESAFDAYVPKTVKGGTIFYDSYMIKKDYKDEERKVYCAPFTELALEELGSDVSTNLIALAFINGVLKLVEPEVLEDALLTTLRANKEMNLRALEIGYREAAKQVG